MRYLRRRTGAARPRAPHRLRENAVAHRRPGLLSPPRHQGGRGRRRHRRGQGRRRTGDGRSPAHGCCGTLRIRRACRRGDGFGPYTGTGEPMLFSGGLRLRRLRLVGIWLSLVGRIRVSMRRGMEGWSQRPGGSAQLERAIPVPSNILDLGQRTQNARGRRRHGGAHVPNRSTPGLE